jgi:hypothetical protein
LLKETTDDLLRLRKDVEAHQAVWSRIEAKKREVVDLERRSRGLMRTLELEREELGAMVKKGREIMESVDKVEKSKFSLLIATRIMTRSIWLVANNDRSGSCTQATSSCSCPGETLFGAYIESSHTDR